MGINKVMRIKRRDFKRAAVASKNRTLIGLLLRVLQELKKVNKNIKRINK